MTIGSKQAGGGVVGDNYASGGGVGGERGQLEKTRLEMGAVGGN